MLTVLRFLSTTRNYKMQSIGCMILDHKKIFVLARDKKYSRCFKKRRVGKMGVRFYDEECYLNLQTKHSIQLKKELLLGQVIAI